MNTDRSLERSVTAWMADEAAGSAGDAVLDDILFATGRTRPAPRWLALLQEPPMHTRSRVTVGSATARLTLVFVILGSLLVGAAAAGTVLLRSTHGPDDWLGPRNDAAHSSRAEIGPVGQPVVHWTFQADGAVSQNLSIAGSLVLAPGDDGILHALDVESGAERWSVQMPAPAYGPSVADGSVYVADGDGFVHALRLDDGTELWRSANRESASALTVAEGRLFAGTATGVVVAIDAGTGNEIWRSSVGGQFRPFRPLAFADGRVFAGADGVGLVALEASTGAPLWTFTRETALGTPVVAGGTVFVSGGDHLAALDTRSGTVRWELDQDPGAPAVLGDRGYADGSDGVVTAYGLADGMIAWRTSFSGAIRTPAVADGVVYLSADTERRVVALDAASGLELWSFDVDGPSQCCVAVARGLVFVGTDLGTVYAIGGDGASVVPQPRRSPPTAATPSIGPTAPASPVPTSTEGPVAAFTWQATSPEPGFVASDLARAPDGRLWVTDSANGRFAIFAPDGTYIESWGQQGDQPGEFDLRRSNGDPYGRIAFASDGSFFVLDAGNRRVQAFDASRGFVTEWGGFGSGPGTFGDPIGIAVSPDGNVSVLDDTRSVIETYRPDGTVVGSFDPLAGIAGGANGLAIDGEGNFYVAAIDPNEVRRFDPDGNLTGTFGAPSSGPGAFSDQPVSIAVDSVGRVFVTQGPSHTDRGVHVFAADGTYIGSWGDPGLDPGQLSFAFGIALDQAGSAFVSEYGNGGAPNADRLQAFRLELP